MKASQGIVTNGQNTERRHCLGGPQSVRGHEQGGQRPVVVISHDVFNARSGTVIALAITSQPQRAGFPLTFELAHAKLPKRSWVKMSQVRTLSVQRLGRKMGRLSPDVLEQLIDGLNEIIS